MRKVWLQLLNLRSVDVFKSVLMLQMWYGERKGRFAVLSKRSDGFTSLLEQRFLRSVNIPVKDGEGLNPATRAKPLGLDHALRLTTYQMFDGVGFHLMNYELLKKNVSRS